MAEGILTLKDRAELVSEMLPGHTLDPHGNVILCPVCPLCGQAMDAWTPTHDIRVNGRMVRVHQICPAEGG